MQIGAWGSSYFPNYSNLVGNTDSFCLSALGNPLGIIVLRRLGFGSLKQQTLTIVVQININLTIAPTIDTTMSTAGHIIMH